MSEMKMGRIVLGMVLAGLLAGCSYHCSSQPPPKPAVTSIMTLSLWDFDGENIGPGYQERFQSALRRFLQKRSFISVTRTSDTHLHVKLAMTPVLIRRYRDIDMFKTEVYVVDKSVHLDAEYTLTDGNGNTIVESSYGKSSFSSAESPIGYADADRLTPLHAMHEALMAFLADAVAGSIVTATEIDCESRENCVKGRER